MVNDRRQHLKEVVYTPESRIRHPVQLFQEIRSDIASSSELAWRLMVRDIKGQYRQAFFGILWAIAPPVVTALGFSLASNAGIIDVGQTIIPYPAFVMLGMVLWQTFTEALNCPQKAIKASRSLLAQVKFPYEAIILSQLGEISFNLVIKLLVTLVIFVIFKAPISWTLIISILPIATLIVFGTAIGLILVPFINLVEDVSRSIQITLLIWFFLTPVTYPSPDEGFLAIINQVNPVSHLLEASRALVTTGMLESPAGFWVMVFITPIIFVLGWVTYRLSMPFIVERIS